VSKLIDRLIQTAETVSLPMGFRTAKAAPPKPKMALIAKIGTAENMAPMADFLSSADAIITAQTGTGKDIARSLPDMVQGLWLEEKSRPQARGPAESGVDFVILPLSSEFGLPSTEKAGKILLVESSLNEGLIRTINELPADAVLLADDREEQSAITWHHLMLCQRFSNLLSKPLLTSAPASVSSDEFKALWQAGVDGVVIAVKTGIQVESLKGLRQIIDQTDFAARPRKKMAALLPRISEEAAAAADVEEEEEEE
jgi:hypothetical protein